MTDAHKQLRIADLDLPAKRGRPKSGNALSNAQKQKIYRERSKQAGKKPVLLTKEESEMLYALCDYAARDYPHVVAGEVFQSLFSKLRNLQVDANPASS
jgi:hypothetical protein